MTDTPVVVNLRRFHNLQQALIQLGGDALTVIGDFIQLRQLSNTCRTLWQILRLRYVSIRVVARLDAPNEGYWGFDEDPPRVPIEDFQSNTRFAKFVSYIDWDDDWSTGDIEYWQADLKALKTRGRFKNITSLHLEVECNWSDWSGNDEGREDRPDRIGNMVWHQWLKPARETLTTLTISVEHAQMLTCYDWALSTTENRLPNLHEVRLQGARQQNLGHFFRQFPPSVQVFDMSCLKLPHGAWPYPEAGGWGSGLRSLTIDVIMSGRQPEQVLLLLNAAQDCKQLEKLYVAIDLGDWHHDDQLTVADNAVATEFLHICVNTVFSLFPNLKVYELVVGTPCQQGPPGIGDFLVKAIHGNVGGNAGLLEMVLRFIAEKKPTLQFTYYEQAVGWLFKQVQSALKALDCNDMQWNFGHEGISAPVTFKPATP
eukprot:TRINITY_DN57749_c0_g1_i1.p1 TRINITY_DN57749_c0_g1~~TRINITY_DN57749_c0_g1_i1.p1  ORF type:complete len:435 (-),score=23.23 TRINITY_DN57749_c0_g1_i1:231-1514(-)